MCIHKHACTSCSPEQKHIKKPPKIPHMHYIQTCMHAYSPSHCRVTLSPGRPLFPDSSERRARKQIEQGTFGSSPMEARRHCDLARVIDIYRRLLFFFFFFFFPFPNYMLLCLLAFWLHAEAFTMLLDRLTNQRAVRIVRSGRATLVAYLGQRTQNPSVYSVPPAMILFNCRPAKRKENKRRRKKKEYI